MAITEIKLANPVEVDGVRYEVLKMRPVETADRQAIHHMNARPYLRGLKLAARLAGLDAPTLTKIIGNDEATANAIGGYVLSQMGGGNRG